MGVGNNALDCIATGFDALVMPPKQCLDNDTSTTTP